MLILKGYTLYIVYLYCVEQKMLVMTGAGISTGIIISLVPRPFFNEATRIIILYSLWKFDLKSSMKPDIFLG